MLAKLITESRIQYTQEVADWKEAIQLAAQPLLKEGVIEESYIEAMINAVNTHGPYMVLADYFALPHAQGTSGVNRLGMSFLNVEKEVDLLGKPVKTFLVLASTDNTEHMEALIGLSELLMEEENLKIFTSGTKEEVLALLNK